MKMNFIGQELPNVSLQRLDGTLFYAIQTIFSSANSVGIYDIQKNSRRPLTSLGNKHN